MEDELVKQTKTRMAWSDKQLERNSSGCLLLQTALASSDESCPICNVRHPQVQVNLKADPWIVLTFCSIVTHLDSLNCIVIETRKQRVNCQVLLCGTGAME